MSGRSPTWSPQQYLKFERERTLPCRDLVSRIELPAPRLIADLGCGPGNSTSVLAERWPGAKITGVDSSTEMLRKAGASRTSARWVRADLRDWEPDKRYDLFFSNAVFHWIADQRGLLTRLLDSMRPRGVMAFQIPSKSGAWRDLLREVAGRHGWRGHIPRSALTPHSREPAFYYDLLARRSTRVDIWETEYMHVLPDHAAILEWVKGSALRPVLDRLSRDDSKAFIEEYMIRILREYKTRVDGTVLFPFRRLFVVAYT